MMLSEKLTEVKNYLRYRAVPKQLSTKLLRYFRFKGSSTTFELEDAKILQELAPSLRAEVWCTYSHSTHAHTHFRLSATTYSQDFETEPSHYCQVADQFRFTWLKNWNISFLEDKVCVSVSIDCVV